MSAKPRRRSDLQIANDHAIRFPADPWILREVGLDGRALAQSESLFALSNGHIGVRGNLDEGDPNGLTGTYLNSFFETRPLPYAEAGYGDPEDGQTILNVTNGKIIRLLVDDEPVDMRYGEIISHERELDLRRGILERRVDWCSPAGKRIRLHSSRLVSFSRRSILAIRYRVEPIDEPARIVVQSELVANEPLPARTKDPRAAAAVKDALVAVEHDSMDLRAHLIHKTRASGLVMAAAMAHLLDVDAEHVTEMVAMPDWARLTVSASLDVGDRFELTKFVAYGWSGTRTVPTLRDQVDAALVSARQTGWDGVAHEQTEIMESYWKGADVEVDGAPEIQRAVRFGMFHAYQAGVRAEQRCIPAKGLTGPGYDGHSFWDTEMFVLPLLTATVPDAAADALRWRQSILDAARDRARTLRLRGAAFPWRTIGGGECSGYWPAGTAALHINADIAGAVARYVWWTGDEDFEREVGLPLLVETARLWCERGYTGPDGDFHIDGVTGPDEYTAVVDDNTYTNLMAKRNLAAAAEVVRKFPDEAARLDVDSDEAGRWQKSSELMAMPYNDDLGVHEQDRGFTRRAHWDFERSKHNDEYPLLLHVPYFDLYRTQVIKQSDLVLAMHWAGENFTAEQKAANFAYYDPMTVRDSSLSACTQAVVAAEVGHLDLAADYLAEAALMDLHNLQKNASDGLHIASLAGGWLALVAGFGGLRDTGERLVFRPQLAPGWTGLRFSVQFHGQPLHVDIGADTVTYSARGDADLSVDHLVGDERERIDIEAGGSVTRPWKPVRARTDRPTQPAGREPFQLPAVSDSAEERQSS
ncbi:glycoside hydrolase family 65 protein [Jatrophihabitans endophyticus]|uniref:glycoside hydrolase family 65 protein n=1 Tax=Jatrophihabitans endophyticus TaxID=1206085 RepID=UPI0019D9646E|nr:glycosyl hydrolase family 65 protein [Jatrophihabitans endophyticus]MBE7187066.1 glycoside hydrolase family 65 protein [Jatrophihabitans endophyticus]